MEEKKLPVLTAKILKGEHKVKFISLVDEPAIEVDAVALSKELEAQVSFQIEDKQILATPILIPNKKIYRNIDGYECYWVFPEDVVKQLAELFNEDGNSQNINLMHQADSKVDGAFLLENWIIESENDKSKNYGFDLPVGTWFGLVKIKDTDFWNSEIKTGNIRGVSIEGLMAFVELQKIKLNKMEYGKFKLEKTATLEDGTMLYTDANEFETGVLVFVVDESGNQFAAKDGDYVIPSYGIISVVDGKVTEVVVEEVKPEEVEQKEEEVKPEEVAPEKVTEKVKAELTPEDIELVKQAIIPLIEEAALRTSALEQKVNELEAGMGGAINEMKQEKEDMKAEMSLMKEQIPTASINKETVSTYKSSVEPVRMSADETLEKVRAVANLLKK